MQQLLDETLLRWRQVKDSTNYIVKHIVFSLKNYLIP